MYNRPRLLRRDALIKGDRRKARGDEAVPSAIDCDVVELQCSSSPLRIEISSHINQVNHFPGHHVIQCTQAVPVLVFPFDPLIGARRVRVQYVETLINTEYV